MFALRKVTQVALPSQATLILSEALEMPRLSDLLDGMESSPTAIVALHAVTVCAEIRLR